MMHSIVCPFKNIKTYATVPLTDRNFNFDTANGNAIIYDYHENPFLHKLKIATMFLSHNHPMKIQILH